MASISFRAMGWTVGYPPMLHEPHVRAIVRPPGQAFQHALRGFSGAARLDAARALEQHRQLVAALQEASVEVIALPEAQDLPDATFVSDTAVALEGLVVVA